MQATKSALASGGMTHCFLRCGLRMFFFRIRPMVLSLALATIPSSTTFSSSRRSVQCARPSGGFEQATAISFASASPSKIFGRAHAGLYCRVSTASNPSSTRRLRARETLLRLVSSASTICRSVHAGPSLDSSAFKRILARVATSTIGRPLCRNSSSRVRSAALLARHESPPSPDFCDGGDSRNGLRRNDAQHYPDGRFAVQFEGTPLEFRVFDKIRTVQPGDIVENKRLSAVLEQVKAQQAAYPPKRQRGHVARQRPPNNLEAPGLPSKGRAPRLPCIPLRNGEPLCREAANLRARHR